MSARSSNCWQDASCIVSPTSTSDLTRVIDIVRSTNTTFSVRSGGHDFNTNHSSIDQSGILIDLVNFNNISLTADKSSLSVGVGAHWGAVDDALHGTGVSVNGAKSPNPGVGGQTLGGGVGWFINSAGVTAASVIGAEVVLANSSVVYASEESDRELLWALRGGGPNFGIVTSFTYRTLPVDKMWFAARLYTSDKNQQLLDALVQYQQAADQDAKAHIVYQLSEDTRAAQSFVGFFYMDPVEWPSIFNPFYDIVPAASMIDSTTGTLSELASRYYNPQYPDAGIPPSRPHNATYQESYAAFVTHAQQAIASGWSLNYGSQPISKNAVKMSSNTPLNLTMADQDWVHVTLQWQSAEDDAAATDLVHKIGREILASAERHESKLEYRFMNDVYEGQGVLSSYGSGVLQRLRDVSRAYDPKGMFQLQQNGGWLLRKELREYFFRVLHSSLKVE